MFWLDGGAGEAHRIHSGTSGYSRQQCGMHVLSNDEKSKAR